MALALAMAAVLVHVGAQPQSPAVADNAKDQLAAAKALEAHAYKTQSVADYRAAAATLESCSRDYPEDLALHRSLGYLYLEKLNEPQLAFPHLQAVYAATPEAADWGQLLAKAAGKIGRTELQIEVLTQVAKREPKDPWCRLDLAKALAKTGRIAEADRTFQDAIKIAPNDEWVNISYAEFLKSQGRTSEAQRIAQKFLATHPESTAAKSLLAGGTTPPLKQPAVGSYEYRLQAAKSLEAHAYLTQSPADYRTAAAALESCSREHPEDLALHRSLGYLYLEKLNEPQLAFPHLQAVYAATPEAAGWGQLLAKAAGETGRTELQIDVLSAVAKREPKDPWCRLDLANALSKVGRDVEAENAFADALRIAPDDEWINISYAQFLQSQGRDLEAESIAKKVLARHPKSAAALTIVGDVRQKNSDFTGAQAAYAEAELAEPNYYGARAGLRELQLSLSPKLESSGYAFSGTDHFFQSGVYNTLTVPLQNHLFLDARFDTGWFHNNETGYASATRYEEGLDLEYRLSSNLSFAGGASAWEVGSHDLAGFDLGVTWKPTPVSWLYGSFRLDDPVNDSIYTVDSPLSQDIVGVSGGWQVTRDLSATFTADRGYYSDGNTRTFIHAEPATYMLWRPLQLRVGPVYELLDYRSYTPNYPSQDWYHTYGPMIEIEPYLCSWLSLKVRYEATRTSDDSKWGTILTVGPSVHLGENFNGAVEYLYDNVPGPFSNYSGNGVQATISYRF